MYEKQKRWIDIAFVLSFLAVLGLFLVFHVIREEESYSYWENRNLASMPAFTLEGSADGSYFSDVETYLADHSPGRRTALQIRTWTDLHILHRPVVNDTVVVYEEDLLLPYNGYEYDDGVLDRTYIDTCAEQVSDNLAAHKALTESCGGYFLYAAVPCQYVCFAEEYPDYLNSRETYTALSAEALFARLTEKGVPYIDMASVYAGDGILQSTSSRIDNHYTISGAFRLYREAVAMINRDTDLGLAMPEESDFTLTWAENPYMGSRIRKLCGLWASEERLGIMTPVTEIPFTRSDNGTPSASTVYALPGNTWDPLLYTVYMGGDIGETVIETGREDLPDILIYGDSFTNALECILWTGFDTMYAYDFRHYTAHTLEELIEAYKPDIVLCVRDYEALLSPDFNGR